MIFLVEYVLRVERLTASKLRIEVYLIDSLLYAFVSEDSFDAVKKILTFLYYRDVSLRTKPLDAFISFRMPSYVTFVTLLSRVTDRGRVFNFHV